MERIETGGEAPKFSSAQEELEYLRALVSKKEQQFWSENVPTQKESVISSEIHEYAKVAAPLAQETPVANAGYEEVVGHIKNLEHREKMREFYSILAEKGIAQAIRYTRELGNPHFEDDFHRVLVEYVKTGALVPGLDKEKDIERVVRKTVYQVTLPFADGKDAQTSLADVIAAMQRFYVGMMSSIGMPGQTLSLEIAMENFSLEVVFFVTVPDTQKDMFLRQIFGVFPTASVSEAAGDYNIFNQFGAVSASVASVSGHFGYPLQTSVESGDPLKVLLSSFAKIERDGEGAAVQVILSSDNNNLSGKLRHAIGKLQQGTDVSSALDIPFGVAGDIRKSLTDFFRSSPQSKPTEQQNQAKLAQREQTAKFLEEKTSQQIVIANLRVVASAANQERADHIREALENAFRQFDRPGSSGIIFTPVTKSRLEKLIYNFTYRVSDDSEMLVLNTLELAHIYHFPSAIEAHEAPQLKAVKASSAPPPSDLPKEGTLLGINKHRGEAKEVRMAKPDRLRHFYVIGQTGTGKSSILKNMIVEDIKAGNGVCFIDPHGSDVQDILAAIPKERIEDVIYFDPSYTPRPFGLNMLEFDPMHPEQKIFVVNELLSIFKKLYASTPEAMGPAFEQYFRNATMLVMEDPETGNTLLEISRVLADAQFRNLKISRCKNPIVVQFWRDIATKTSGDSGLANMIPYITNKFDVFLSNDVMRPIIAQEESSFNFRYVMDNKKILLVNLAKGRLGDINANLIGLVLVGKLLMAALSRVDSFGKQLPDFYLYIDEFQNITTDSISAILSEARKYGLSLNVAHQFIAQLDPSIKDAVFGNVGNMAIFRVGPEDAQFLETQFAPVFTAPEIMKIENYNCYLKMLVNGRPVPPFNIETLPPVKGDPEIVEKLKQLSYLRFGRDRKVVDEAIMKKYLSVSQSQAPQKPAPTPMVTNTTPPPSFSAQSVSVVQAPFSSQQFSSQSIPSVVAPKVMSPAGVPLDVPKRPADLPVPPGLSPTQQGLGDDDISQPFRQAFLRSSDGQDQLPH